MTKRKLVQGGLVNDQFAAPMNFYQRLRTTLRALVKIKNPDDLVILEIESCSYFMRECVWIIESLGGTLDHAAVPHHLIGQDTDKMKFAREMLDRRRKDKPTRDAMIMTRLQLIHASDL